MDARFNAQLSWAGAPFPERFAPATGRRGGRNAADREGSEGNQVREVDWAFSLVKSFRLGLFPD
ncbi:hypothetical protein [Bradyrhizobium sp. SEMIA]|uniref:hypothetical protein n=1 Tax=Bradyrhizobium sp. SEMIA TaxID=2597515 RepID=UPI0018A45483|nr:hypothetical protein [Bradyrhizobium sp. SEMIA]QOG20579.1 hypothetical protein FOM02_27730 [Bradyrhizobium sp. SEMIA]